MYVISIMQALLEWRIVDWGPPHTAGIIMEKTKNNVYTSEIGGVWNASYLFKDNFKHM